MLAQEYAVCLAATDADGALRGYAAGTVVADEGEVLNLAVAPAFRRRGVARLLLTALLDALHARGAQSLFLEVRASNAAALALYRAFGFRELGRRIAYYRAPREDAITMVKDHSVGMPKNDAKLHEFG